MNPMKSRNLVARILQVYAWVNAGAGAISALLVGTFLSDDLHLYETGWVIAAFYFAAVILSSFLLYAFGEVIDLLHEIRSNTSKKTETILSDELPEL